MNIDLICLTKGERLRVWRRRHAIDQRHGAKRLRVERDRYCDVELDRSNGLAPPEPIAPTVPELLWIARRRSGLTLTKTAVALGVSRPTVRAWEDRADPRIIAFWGRKPL